MAQRRVKPIISWLSGLLTSVILVAAVTGLDLILQPRTGRLAYVAFLYVLAIMPAAIGWGTGLAVVTAVLSAAVFNYVFIPPRFAFNFSGPNLLGAVAFLVTAVVVGQLADRLRRAAADSARFAEEQAALRRIATLVARSAPPSEVFQAVTHEVGLLCRADLARMERYEPDGSAIGVAAWSRAPGQRGLAVDTRLELSGPSIAGAVLRTGAAARVASFVGATGAIAEEACELGIRSSVGCPITVAGHLWGVIAASTKSNEPFPWDTEDHIAEFAGLVATAIAASTTRAELIASRARIVAAADDARRRLERDLHDGAQQRLVSLALRARVTHECVPAELVDLRTELSMLVCGLSDVTTELREISRGIHPAILSAGGLASALKSLAHRSTLPVSLDVAIEQRLPDSVEVAAYYVIAEALTNTAKHAHASEVSGRAHTEDGALYLSVHDNGTGGADFRKGSGLIGLKDRVEALGGQMDVTSPPGSGTTLDVTIPFATTPR